MAVLASDPALMTDVIHCESASVSKPTYLPKAGHYYGTPGTIDQGQYAHVSSELHIAPCLKGRYDLDKQH